MSMQLRPLHPLFVAEVSGLDLSRPLDPAVAREIEQAMDTHAVLVFRNQTLTQIHAGSGRPLLFVGVHARAIIGYTVPEGRMLLSDLLEHATRREFVYRHEWRVGDLVMWDDRSTIHRGRRYDLNERRELRRSTTEDLAPVRAVAA